MNFDKILEAAIRAPSGDNCQPWRLEIENNTLRIYNIPERDTSLYNYRQRASLVAHGALLENMEVAASAQGYSIDVCLFPDKASPDLIAEVTLLPKEFSESPLYQSLFKRCTNRRRYQGGRLADEQFNALMQAVKGERKACLHLLKGKELQEIASIIGLNDRIVFENRLLHQFLFEQIRWSEEEAVRTGDGLDIRTLELTFPDSKAFPLLKHWSLVKVLSMFGITHIIEQTARKLALSAACIGVITMEGTTRTDYVNAGRLMERIWLEATKAGLAFQVMTGITFLMQLAEEGNDVLSAHHLERLRSARSRVVKLCGEGKVIPAIIFRLGRAAHPTVMSRRRVMK